MIQSKYIYNCTQIPDGVAAQLIEQNLEAFGGPTQITPAALAANSSHAVKIISFAQRQFTKSATAYMHVDTLHP